MDCLFCAIIAGDIPSRQVYADDVAVAFLDINPWHDGHTLVVPRRHVTDVLSDPSALGEIADSVTATAALLTEKLECDGLNVLINSGAVAGQEVFHLHVHLIPRFAESSGMAGLMERDATGNLDEVYQRLIA